MKPPDQSDRPPNRAAARRGATVSRSRAPEAGTHPVGAAAREVPPTRATGMSFYAARTSGATGTHAPITVRALAVGPTVLLTVDACAIEAASCDRIRRAVMAADPAVTAVVTVATHTHSGPALTPGRLGGGVDPAYLAALEAACAEVALGARADARPARAWLRWGADPGVARNRRHPGGPLDPSLPLLRFAGADGSTVAALVAYGCHPVTLGPANTRWSPDYPGVVRAAVEHAFPGAVALFVTGCAGDVDPIKPRPEAEVGADVGADVGGGGQAGADARHCAAVGEAVAAAALAGRELPLSGPVGAARRRVSLTLARPGQDDLERWVRGWRAELAGAPPARRARIGHWLAWAAGPAIGGGGRWEAPVSVLRWFGLGIACLPGEPFAETSLALRRRAGEEIVVAQNADGACGYLPPAGEYRHGGYEVEEAHRFYGMCGPFAPGSAETVQRAAEELLLSTPGGT